MAMDEGDKLNMIALVVALVALFASLGQLLQAMFGTADGYRKCQWSVIGPWAKLTRLKWRWREFRFETKFTTPVIGLASCDIPNSTFLQAPGFSTRRGSFVDILGKTSGVLLESIDFVHNLRADPELVSWVRLLLAIWAVDEGAATRGDHGQLCIGEFVYTENTAIDSLPPASPPVPGEIRCALKLVERSWDLMPADLATPTASTTVKNIIIIAHRMGMVWHKLDPFEGPMNAQGYGHMLTSTTIKGLGIALTYYFGAPDSVLARWVLGLPKFIPCDIVDKLHCGIITVDIGSAQMTYPVIGDDGTLSPLPSMLQSCNVLDLFQGSFKGFLDCSSMRTFGAFRGPGRLYHCALNEFVSLNLPFLLLQSSSASKIAWPLPMEEVNSVFDCSASRYAMLHRICRLHRHCACLNSSFDGEIKNTGLHRIWEILKDLEYADRGYLRFHEALLKCRKAHDETSQYFASLHRETEQPVMMDNHIQTWVARSLRASEAAKPVLDLGRARGPFNLTHQQTGTTEDARRVEAETNAVISELAAQCRPVSRDLDGPRCFVQELRTMRDTVGEDTLFLSELVHQCFDELEDRDLVHPLSHGQCSLDPDVEGWLYLLLRGISWWIPTRVVPQETVIPSSYYGLSMPVYLM